MDPAVAFVSTPSDQHPSDAVCIPIPSPSPSPSPRLNRPPPLIPLPYPRHPPQRARYVRDLRSILERERDRREGLQSALLNIDAPFPDLAKREAKYAVQALEASVEWLDSEVYAMQAHLMLLLSSPQSRLNGLPQGAAVRQRSLLLTDLE